MAKLETVDRIREAIDAAPQTAVRDNPSRLDGQPWEVFSIRQDGKDWPVKVHSAHMFQSDAHTAWVMLEREKIARAVVETLREPDMYMLHAGLDRLGGAANARLSGPALEEVWTAMVDHLLSKLPAV